MLESVLGIALIAALCIIGVLLGVRFGASSMQSRSIIVAFTGLALVDVAFFVVVLLQARTSYSWAFALASIVLPLVLYYGSMAVARRRKRKAIHVERASKQPEAVRRAAASPAGQPDLSSLEDLVIPKNTGRERAHAASRRAARHATAAGMQPAPTPATQGAMDYNPTAPIVREPEFAREPEFVREPEFAREQEFVREQEIRSLEPELESVFENVEPVSAAEPTMAAYVPDFLAHPAAEPEPVAVPEPVAEIKPVAEFKPVPEPKPEPLVEVAPEPEPVIEAAPEPEAEAEPWRSPWSVPVSAKAKTSATKPEPEPIPEAKPEPKPEPASKPVVAEAPTPTTFSPESYFRRAEVLRNAGAFLVATKLYAECAAHADSQEVTRKALMQEITCYVKGGDLNTARNHARSMMKEFDLTATEKLKIGAVLGVRL